MNLISYAQNNEDILIWRALRHLPTGFYVDVGANDPSEDSVTRLFYDRGWRGINVEPSPEYFERLARDRTRDINLSVAVGNHDGIATFFENATRGWSTSDQRVGAYYVAQGQAKVLAVEQRTLDAILQQHGEDEIHFLKIDVEGAEAAVLQGLDLTRRRPWVIVVEAIDPVTHRPRTDEWEPRLLASSYDCVYFDGLNRFYLAHEHRDLANAFTCPPNILDAFRNSREFVLEQRIDEAAAHRRSRELALEQRFDEAVARHRSRELALEQRIAEVVAHHRGAVVEVERLRAKLEKQKVASRNWRRPFHFLRDLGRVLRRTRKGIGIARYWRRPFHLLRDMGRALRRKRKALDGSSLYLRVTAGENAVVDLPADVAIAYKRLLALRSGSAKKKHLIGGSDRPRLAYVSPFPPTKSGISDYSAELLPALARHYDIDVISGNRDKMSVTPTGALSVIGVADFQRTATLYDHVLYHLGNSKYHCYMLPLIERIPGVVVLHDFFLGHLMQYMERNLQSGVWSQSLYHSHGYRGYVALVRADATAEINFTYPANLDFLELAQGVIVHSDFSRRLAATYYRSDFANSWAVIPSLRRLPDAVDRSAVRLQLGFAESDIVVCSFGVLGPTKKNDLVVGAWDRSLARYANCHLVFVGEQGESTYYRVLCAQIDASASRDRIRVTGFVDREKYQAFLSIADIAVQLRERSRGETSAAVRDCMGHGIATIVNLHATMADLPNNAVLMLPDNLSVDELAAALSELHDDAGLRGRLGQRAREYIKEYCAPVLVADLYRTAIERFAEEALPIHRLDGLKRTASLLPKAISNPAWRKEANAVSNTSNSSFGLRQIFFDVSVVSLQDYGTGIQRVVKAHLLGLIDRQPQRTRIEPVRLVRVGDEWTYRYAREYACGILNIRNELGPDAPITAHPGDILLVSDFDPNGFSSAALDGMYARLRSNGVSIHVMVYDLLPILRPEFFPPGVNETHNNWLQHAAKESEQLICISRSVANDVNIWATHELSGTSPSIGWIHLGADLGAVNSSIKETQTIPDSLDRATTFLLVGTIEPRKGHLQTLAAFDILWSKGVDVNLVFFGQEGWKSLPDSQRRTIPQIVSAILRHPLLGRRLFWFANASDTTLEAIYTRSSCLLVPSEGEGFGLPLIEGARHRLPVLARDLAVFREIGGPHVCYFEGLSGDSLARAVEDWLALFYRGEHIRSDALAWRTWSESVDMLLAALALDASDEIT